MKNLRKTKIAIIVIAVILIITPIIIKLTRVKADDTVRLSLVPQPYIDIVVSKGKTGVDLDDFEDDILAALDNLGVKTANVRVLAAESYKLNIQDAFTWETDLDSTIGNITITENGQNVVMIGNKTLPGKNAIYIMQDEDIPTQTFSFDYDLDFGDSFKAAGMLLRVKKVGNTLTGYMLSLNYPFYGGDLEDMNEAQKSDERYEYFVESEGNYGAIWEFSYDLNNHSNPINKELKKAFEIERFGNMTVKVTNTEIEVYSTTTSAGHDYKFGPYIYKLEKPIGTGIGFFAEHYSHNCDRIGEFRLENINLKTELYKTFEEVLREPDWRKGAIKVLVDVSDFNNEEISKPNSLGEAIARTVKDELHYIGWGQSANRNQMQKIIDNNNKKGQFINNTNYQNCINQTAAYIQALIQGMTSTDYVILGENTILANSDETIMKNTAGGNWPYGRWKIIHDHEYYENNIGQFAHSGKYISDMITSFDKTGKYEIYYEDKHVLPTQIYVHRRPVAKMNLVRNGNNIELTSSSYDLDKFSSNEGGYPNGIAEEEWSYKEIDASNWTKGKLTTVTSGGTYLVQLRVKDLQGAWSMPDTQYITSDSTSKPVADFEIYENEITIYDELEVEDLSYDPYGGRITGWKWTVYKDDRQIYTGSRPLTNYATHGVGTYKMSLVVTNNRNIKSEEFSRTFKVIEDSSGPECIIEPTECDWKKSIDISVRFTDPSGIRNYQYAVTKSQTKPASSAWSSTIAKSADTITINEEGTWYLHVKATNNAGYTSEERVVGPYKIDRTAPAITISPEEKDWTKNNVQVTFAITDSKSGFKSYQYAVTESTSTPSSYSSWIENKVDAITISDEGVWYLHIKAKDKAGNTTEDIVKGPYKIDKTGPIIEIEPESRDWDNTDLIPFSISVKDEEGASGLAEWTCVWRNQDGIEFESKIARPREDGIWYVTITATDNVGNTSQKTAGPYKIDKTAPTVTVTPERQDWAGDATVDLSFSDSLSGFKSYQYALTKNTAIPNNYSSEIAKSKDKITISNEGTWYLHIKATDNVGNATEDIIKGPYKVDKTPPTVTVTPESKAWTKGDIGINLTIADNQSGIDSYKYKISNSQNPSSDGAEGGQTFGGTSPTKEHTKTITVTDEGIWYLHIEAIDRAGNTTGNITKGPYRIDKTPPTANIAHTPTGWVIDYVTINWSFTDSKSGMDYCILPDGTRTSDTSGRYVVGNNGDYTFKAYDKVGNERIVTEKITNIDKIAPGGVLSVSNNQLTDNSIQILWEAYDRESGFSKIILPDSTISNNATGSFPISQMGEYSFVIYDRVGNDKKLTIVVDNVDMEKPTLVVTQKETKWTNEDIILDYEAKDNQSGIREVVFPNSQNTSEAKGKYTVTKNGDYTFLAYDRIGNGVMVTHTVNNIDKTPPLLKLKRDYDNDDNIKITWEMSDSESGIRNIVLPNGKITSEARGEYIVKKNGGYTFIAYDNVGNDNTMQVEISHLDKEGIKFELYQEKIDEEHYRISWKVLEGQDDFRCIVLPNNEYSQSEQGSYIVEKEGIYTFQAYDKSGNETKHSVIIYKQIDKITKEAIYTIRK